MVALTLAAVLVMAFVVWREIGKGPDTFQTTIELRQPLSAQGIEALQAAIGTRFKETCRNQNENGICVWWIVGDLGAEAVFIWYRESGNKLVSTP